MAATGELLEVIEPYMYHVLGLLVLGGRQPLIRRLAWRRYRNIGGFHFCGTFISSFTINFQQLTAGHRRRDEAGSA